MALSGAFSEDPTEQKLARGFITTSLGREPEDLFDSPTSCRRELESLPPSPDHMFFFEYNFLYVLAAGGRPDKTSLGDHSPAGYAQRARFYSITSDARLNFSKGVAHYIIFLAATTGLVEPNRCATAAARVDHYTTLDEMLADICT
jgi:hypothetical protein